MTSASVRHITPAFRTFAGDRSLSALDKDLTRSDCQRVMLVCGASMLRHGDALALVEAAIGNRLVSRFSDVREHSPVDSVEAAARQLTSSEADAVVALGGGSAVVTTRAAAILSAEDRPVRDLATRRENGRLTSPRLAAPKIPQFIVPSTPTTAYAKAGAAVRDVENGERFALFDPKARAAGVYMHPRVASTAPARLARSSSLNAFVMAVDGLQSGVEDPLAEANMRQALRMLGEWMPQVTDPIDGSAGVQLMLASLLSGMASDHLGTGLAQPLAHALGPLSTVGNGVVEAMILPFTMRFNIGHTDQQLVAVAEALRPTGPWDPDSAIHAVEEFLADVGVPTRLRDVGIDRASFEMVADHVMDDWSSTTVPRRADRTEILGILHSAW
jgi:alcohol dehydrogenase class IV